MERKHKLSQNDPNKTCSNTRLDTFGESDLIFDQTLVQNRTECTPNPRYRKLNGYRRRPQRVRKDTNADCQGFDIDFDRQMNDFTNPRSNQNNRRKCCPQNFFYETQSQENPSFSNTF